MRLTPPTFLVTVKQHQGIIINYQKLITNKVIKNCARIGDEDSTDDGKICLICKNIKHIEIEGQDLCVSLNHVPLFSWILRVAFFFIHSCLH